LDALDLGGCWGGLDFGDNYLMEASAPARRQSHWTVAKIEVGCVPAESSETRIFIHDNGVGFDPKYTERLFGAFQRLHRQDEFEGTGIGLANVQRIIRRQGCRTWAEGIIDGGATIYFSIPAKESSYQLVK
jgi:light-regulated signal transduction histidine kinase (bacteriophytochrome)